MKPYNYKKIDAFTAGTSPGNPAACIYLDEGQTLTDAQMLAIAKQHKGFVSEVVYCKERGDSSFEMIYYSSECEVPFCGHGTIACMAETLKGRQGETIIHTRRKGSLTVYNRLSEEGAVYIAAPEPVYLEAAVSTEAFFGANPAGFIDAGNRTLIVAMGTLAETISLFPNEQALKDFSLTNGIDVILIFCMDTESKTHKAHTRVFAEKYGYLEDPATGSASAAFGYYMLKNGLWDGGKIMLEQGGRVYNTVHLCVEGGKLLFGGGTTTRIEGVYYI